MKRICIDARFYGVSHTGIGRYVENLVINLPNQERFEVVLILSKDNTNIENINKYKKFFTKHHPYSIASFIEMHWLLFTKIKPDLLHVPHITVPFLWPGKIIITVHDLTKHNFRGVSSSTKNSLIYWIKYFQYLLMVNVSLRIAKHIIVPSNYWKDELIKKFSIEDKKITCTYEGISGEYLNIKAPLISKVENYLVYTGNLYPHKNVGILIDTAERMHINVKIICARSVFEKRLPKSKYAEYLGKVDDNRIIEIYKSAIAFVFPSLSEGFGLPGLEAMAVGTPVISSNSTCLPEIYGDAALYFDPNSSSDLENQINLLKNSSTLREMMIDKGLNRVRTYSWVKMAKQTWEIYQKELR